MSDEETNKPADEKPAEKTEETKEEEEGETPSDSKPTVDEAKKILDEIKIQNKIFADNIQKAEKLATENLLGGKSKAGQEKTKEDEQIESAKNLLKGTGFDEQLFPSKKE